VFVPSVLYQHLEDAGSSSDLGDVTLGATKRLLSETERLPELLLTGRWKTRTGNSTGLFRSGSGVDALQVGGTVVKTDAPIVLFGSPSYTFNLSSDDLDLGDVAGLKLGGLLAVTPDTSVLLDVDLNPSFETRVGGFAIGDSDRLSGVVELGVARVLSKHTLLNVTAGIGFTDTAPDFRLATSLPVTFY
jgi:hypothetical protein